MSNPTQQEQDQIELETISIEHAISMGEALNRLRKNPDFQKVILDGYCRDQVLRQHSLLGVPQVRERGDRSHIMEDMVASSNLLYYFMVLDHEYEGATNPILSDEEEAELEAQQNETPGGVN